MATVDVWLTTGQSQMVGTSGKDGKNTHPTTNPALCWEWDGGPNLVQVDDDVSCGGDYKALTGSMVPAFTNVFTEASGRPSVIVRAAVGGTALLASNAQGGLTGNGHWDTNGQLFPNSVTRCLDALADIQALGHTIGRVHVLWSQGYRDAQGGNDLELYEAANAALVSRWRTALSQPTLKVYIEEMYAPAAASAQTAENCLYIRDAQRAAVASTEGLEIAFAEGQYAEERHWLTSDNLHFNQAGLNYMGQAYARYIAADFGLTIPEPVIQGSPTSLAARLLLSADPVYGSPTWILPGTYTWKVPGNVTSIGGESIGGGGGGGGSNSLTNNGGGGGGGAYAADPTIAVTPFEELTIEVGSGGTGGQNGTGGSAGGPSGIKRNSTWLIKADGGINGFNVTPWTGGSAGLAANSVGEITTSGTNGAVGGNTGSLGNGGAAASGGTLVGGAGGIANTNTGTQLADPGDAPGGGGASKRNGSAAGGLGARGTVKITLA